MGHGPRLQARDRPRRGMLPERPRGGRKLPLADASLLYGHLRKEGIPYEILLANGINHPDRRGMALFSRALLELFRPACGGNAAERGDSGTAEKKNTNSEKEHER